MRKTLWDDQYNGKMPTWWKVWMGFCIMATIAVCAFGAWVVVEVVQWVTSK